MKQIDEKYFTPSSDNQNITAEQLLNKNEKILWKGTPRRFAYIMSKTITQTPLALIWLVVDLFFLIIIPNNMFKDITFLMFIIVFFAIHLFPVWMWIYSAVKASKEMNSIQYIITNLRIIEINGISNKYIKSQIKLTSMNNIQLKRSTIDKILKVGDIYISAKNNKTNMVLFDITNCEFIYNQINKLCHDTNNVNDQFYKKNYECMHCGTYYDKTFKRCPSCGSPQKK